MLGVIVIGAGPGIGTAVARRFAREGFRLGVLARSPATVDAALAAVADHDIATHGVTADVTDEPGLRSALDELMGRLGVPDVLVYNAAIIQRDSIGDLSARQHLEAPGQPLADERSRESRGGRRSQRRRLPARPREQLSGRARPDAQRPGRRLLDPWRSARRGRRAQRRVNAHQRTSAKAEAGDGRGAWTSAVTACRATGTPNRRSRVMTFESTRRHPAASGCPYTV
jgi:NAD(P)-dependent dehydrogenase (short-subunit alcohol dehydrogenase family)